MASKGRVENNQKRKRMIESFCVKRELLKKKANDKSASIGERVAATMQLAKLPRNSSATRYRNRCALTGRSRAYYRKFDMSRIALRMLASQGEVPGVFKASW